MFDAMCGGKMSDMYSIAKAVEGLGIRAGTVAKEHCDFNSGIAN